VNRTVRVDSYLRGRELSTLRVDELAAVLFDLADQIRNLDAERWPRHDVRPAAVQLLGGVVGALAGADPWTPYETDRADAREMGFHLAWVVTALRAKADQGDDVDLAALRAYEDELAAQDGAMV
jgi:hypothetical protein